MEVINNTDDSNYKLFTALTNDYYLYKNDAKNMQYGQKMRLKANYSKYKNIPHKKYILMPSIAGWYNKLD